MRKVLIGVTAIGGLAALVVVWMRYTRIGSGFANEVVNPYLVRRGISGSRRSELGTLEHVGRTSGIRRLTPLHPVATETGFRIGVPLGERSEWARNVLAAGHCRMQLHDVVYELDEPALLAASEIPEIAPPVGWVLDLLGFEYLFLRRFAEAAGRLEPVEEPATGLVPVADEAAPTTEAAAV